MKNNNPQSIVILNIELPTIIPIIGKLILELYSAKVMCFSCQVQYILFPIFIVINRHRNNSKQTVSEAGIGVDSTYSRKRKPKFNYAWNISIWHQNSHLVKNLAQDSQKPVWSLYIYIQLKAASLAPGTHQQLHFINIFIPIHYWFLNMFLLVKCYKMQQQTTKVIKLTEACNLTSLILFSSIVNKN